MSRFVFKKESDFEYDNPQDMYRDYKQKRIKGLLDYQTEILKKYMSESERGSNDLSLELPTGSGKTLVGLLICEFRRRKYHERVVFVCLNKQLVRQVIDEARQRYQIPVVGFTGKFSEYSQNDFVKFEDSSAIAVVDYSAIFNNYSKFSEVGTFIFDDAHNASDYIDNNWTVRISKVENESTFDRVVAAMRSVLDDTSIGHLSGNVTPDSSWCNMLTWPAQDEVSERFIEVVSYELDKDNDSLGSSYYAWKNIQDHLPACNIFFSETEILIKPQIPPTQELIPFRNAKQRVYMSATAGRSGELQRSFGIREITQISIPEKHVPSIGRRLFIFPNVKSFNKDNEKDIFMNLKAIFPRGVALLPKTKDADEYQSLITNYDPEITIYTGDDLQCKMNDFAKDRDAVAVLANRYDGINFPDDSCHLLLLKNFPRYQNLQDRFFTTRLRALPLLAETLKNRITQASGRCTRSTTDFAVVIIEGNELQSALNSFDRLELFAPELRAEIQTGYQVSKTAKDFSELQDIAQLILNQNGSDWKEIDQEIIAKRDEFQRESDELPDMYKQLRQAAGLEVQFQRYIWNANYSDAQEISNKIIETIKDQALDGLAQYWRYVEGALYYRLNKPLDKEISVNIFKSLRKGLEPLTWFQALDKFSGITNSLNDLAKSEGIARMCDRIESYIERETMGMEPMQRIQFFNGKYAEVLRGLRGSDGNKFERAMVALGKLAGFDSNNTTASSGPDPWWIVDSKTYIVTEDKIYLSEKPIPTKHVRESAAHPNWIQKHFNITPDGTRIINVFITNSTLIEGDAKEESDAIYYINQNDIVIEANKIFDQLGKLYRAYRSPGDMLWRDEATQVIAKSDLSPKSIIKFFTRRKLSELATK